MFSFPTNIIIFKIKSLQNLCTYTDCMFDMGKIYFCMRFSVQWNHPKAYRIEGQYVDKKNLINCFD